MPYKDAEKQKQFQKKWNEDNKEKMKQYQKDWYKKNKENIKIEYENNKKQIKYKRKIYRKKNIKKILEKNNIYKNNKIKTNPLFKLTNNIRTLIRNGFKYKNYNKNTRTQTILGCSFQEFKQHIEAQFEPWMNWDNGPKPYSENERTWQIDHKIPVSFAKTEEEIIKLNHYTNLRPYCAKANITEGNRRDGEKEQI